MVGRDVREPAMTNGGRTGVRDPEDLTTEWLGEAVGADVVSFASTRIGTGQLSDSHRVELTYANGAYGPASVVLKVAASDARSRETGAALGLYVREVRFYDEVAPRIGGPLASCYSASFDRTDNTFSLLLGDAGPARQGDEIAGASRHEADVAVAALAAIHEPLLGDAGLGATGWLNRRSPINGLMIRELLPGFLDRYAARLAPEHRDVCRRLAADFDGWSARAVLGPQGLMHGDYRLDNMLFGERGSDRPVTVVDWQTVTWGSVITDLAYFQGCALRIEDRRAWGDELLSRYHDGLGAKAPSLDECRETLRRQSFFGVMMGIISPMLVTQTERGDDMFMTAMARHAQQVIDLDALSLLDD